MTCRGLNPAMLVEVRSARCFKRSSTCQVSKPFSVDKTHMQPLASNLYLLHAPTPLQSAQVPALTCTTHSLRRVSCHEFQGSGFRVSGSEFRIQGRMVSRTKSSKRQRQRNRMFTTVMCPSRTALCIGVSLSASDLTLGLAPYSSTIFAHSTCPPAEAYMSAVLPCTPASSNSY